MRELLIFCLALMILTSSYPALPGEEVEEDPEELYQKAYFSVREAKEARYRKDTLLAYEKYMEAVEIYRKIRERFPDWKSKTVLARISQYLRRASEIGENIFHLPEGYLGIKPGMIREGKRFRQGEALRFRVKKVDENHYEVKGHTVTLVRAGPKLGASCDCPDFRYRGIKYGFACKHIWAVILKEKLLEQEY